MSDKMRDEFEIAWAESRCDDDGIIGNKPTRSAVNSDCYTGGAAQFAWVWWKRSRAAMATEGWQMVPVVATKDMFDAWDSAPNNDEDDAVNMRRAYRAMLDAVPKP